MKLSRVDEIKAKEISEKYKIDLDLVKKIISSQYEFIHKTCKEINFDKEMSKEEFSKIKTNFNIPGIGKLYASHYLHKKITNRTNKKNKKKLG
tara:strand:+ start:1418 stop:1696 length:279 start_codon:yes stop_codon:yes gene_type:complete